MLAKDVCRQTCEESLLDQGTYRVMPARIHATITSVMDTRLVNLIELASREVVTGLLGTMAPDDCVECLLGEPTAHNQIAA